MAAPRHVSRWQLCRPPQTLASPETSLSSPPNAPERVRNAPAFAPPVSLRYLNEFVGKLHCAPALLQHGLFPDAKEVTESMALFNAVRRYIEPEDKAWKLEENGRHDGIVVVGDGNTPRTAALFAFRMKGWKCYSVDPAMEKGTSERSKGWAEVSNLVVVRNKIENVRIALRRAIVVLVHAHVTLEQALSAVQAEQVCGVVTLPCCNWYGEQEVLFGRGPDLVYDDFSVLSDHREIRLWVGDNVLSGRGSVDTSHADLSLASSVMKGCVRKEIAATDANLRTASAPSDENAEAEELRKRHDGVLDFIGETLSELARDASSMTQEEYVAEEHTIGSSLPSAVTSHLGTDTHVLVLGWHPRRLAVRLLLRGGYSNVYTLSLAEEVSVAVEGSGRRGTKRLKLQLLKCTVNLEADEDDGEDESVKLEPCGVFVLQSSFVLPRADKPEAEDEEEKITVLFETDGVAAPPLACVLDAGFVFRGFRGRAKKNPAFFRHLCRTLGQLVSACDSPARSSRSASLVCLTPRKQWRRKEFLTHAELGFDVLSLIATRTQFPGTPVYVYCCFKRQTLSSLATATATEKPSEGTASVARDAAIETWVRLEKELQARQAELESTLVVIDSPAARAQAAEEQEQAVAEVRGISIEPRKVYVQVTGDITRVRRFSNGMAFLSLALAGPGHDRPVQVFLQRDTLGWPLSVFAKVLSLLRKGDELVAVGFMARNARGHSMVQVEALSLARTGEYEAYD